MDVHLEAVLVEQYLALNADEVIALKGVHHLGHVIPHLGVDFAGFIAKEQRKVGVSPLFLADVFVLNEKDRNDLLVRL